MSDEHTKISESDSAPFDPLQIGVSKQQLIARYEEVLKILDDTYAQNELLRGQIQQMQNEQQLEKKEEPGKRFDEGKLDYHLLPVPFLVELTKLYTAGAIKYDPENWRKGMSYSRMIRCVWSHWLQWLCGIKKDPETGVHSCVMAAWNCAALFMYEMHLHKEEFDDRQDNLSHEDFQCPEEFKALREKYQGKDSDAGLKLETKPTVYPA